MVLKTFPDLHWLKQQAEERFSNRKDVQGNVLPHSGWPNVILNVNTRNVYRDNIRGPLSLFMNIKGESIVEVDLKRNRIREGFYYISNHDQYYTLAIDEKVDSETFNIHFGEYFVDQVWDSLIKEESFLLENNFVRPNEPFAFHNRIEPKNSAFNHVIQSLLDDGKPSNLALEEKLTDLIQIILQEEMQLGRIMEKIPTLKTSTRKQIFKRLITATDFIYANYQKDISLDEIAQACCLSKFHFLRLFKIAFGTTPARFIEEIRVRKAIEMLRNTRINVAVISAQLGYENASSFSRMFRNQTGVYPSDVRGT